MIRSRIEGLHEAAVDDRRLYALIGQQRVGLERFGHRDADGQDDHVAAVASTLPLPIGIGARSTVQAARRSRFPAGTGKQWGRRAAGRSASFGAARFHPGAP